MANETQKPPAGSTIVLDDEDVVREGDWIYWSQSTFEPAEGEHIGRKVGHCPLVLRPPQITEPAPEEPPSGYVLVTEGNFQSGDYIYVLTDFEDEHNWRQIPESMAGKPIITFAARPPTPQPSERELVVLMAKALTESGYGVGYDRAVQIISKLSDEDIRDLSYLMYRTGEKMGYDTFSI